MPMDAQELYEKRRALGIKLPSLATRIFALSGKVYQGYGFHWSLLKDIGKLLYRINDYDSKSPTWDILMVDEIIYESLLEQVEKAEKEVKQRTPPAKPSSNYIIKLRIPIGRNPNGRKTKV